MMQGNLEAIQRFLTSGGQLNLVRGMTMYKLESVSGEGVATAIQNPIYSLVRLSIILTTKEVAQLNGLVDDLKKMEARGRNG